MYGAIIELVVVAAVIVLVNGDTVKYYATKYDHLDIERILNNRRMVTYYGQCLLSKGPCPPQGVEFKRILPEALETNCLRCTEKQKVVTYRTIKRLKKEYPKVWVELQAKWDPNDVYVKRFEETYKNPIPTTTNENEILLDDRFGVIDTTTRKSTTKIVTKKPQKTKYPSTASSTITTQRTVPSINSLDAGSQNKPSDFNPYNPNFGGNVSTNQVGDNGSTQNINSVNTTVSVFTENNTNTEVPSQSSVTYVNTQSSRITPLLSIVNITGISTRLTPEVVTTSKFSDTSSLVTPQVIRSDKTEVVSTVSSPETPLLINLFTSNFISVSPSSVQSGVQKVAVISTSRKPLVNKARPGVTFDIPPSSLSNSLTLTILQNSPITANSGPVSASFPESPSTASTSRPTFNSQSGVTSGNRQPDVITQVLSSFFNNNRIPSISVGASLNETVSNEPVNRPGLQIRLPSISYNGQAEVLNPLGSFVRDITSAGSRLIETGTSIADSFLTSVRSLFTPPGRSNRPASSRSLSP